MIRRAIQSYFFFNTAVRYLQDASDGTRIADYEQGWGICSNLQQIMSYMVELNLRVSQQTVAAGRLKAMLKEFEESDEASVLSAEQA